MLTLALVGLVAQMIDGSLGMAYGVTSTTLLVTAGTTVVLASASVHIAEIGTTLIAGISHSLFGNVDWRAVGLMAFPGAVGGFLGAVVLTSIDGDVAKPWVAGILLTLGIYILWRFLGSVRASPIKEHPLPARLLSPLGFIAGFIDAVGGGGWGPIGTPALLSSGRVKPRKAVGTVDTGEFLVALGASIGFLVSFNWNQIPIRMVVALLAGGLIAAPLAAYLVRSIRPRKMGVIAGAAIVLVNTQTLTRTFGLENGPRLGLYFSIVLVVGAVAALRLLQVRREPSERVATEPAYAESASL